jgi:hypothetical protein
MLRQQGALKQVELANALDRLDTLQGVISTNILKHLPFFLMALQWSSTGEEVANEVHS